MSIIDEVNKLDGEIKKLKSERERSARERADLLDANSMLTRELETARRDRTTDHDRQAKQITDLRLQNSRLGATQEALHAEIREVRAERDRMRKDLSRAREVSDEAALRELRGQLEAARTTKETAEKIRLASVQQVGVLRNEAEKASRRATDAEAAASRTNRELSEARNQITKLQQNLSKVAGEAEKARNPETQQHAQRAQSAEKRLSAITAEANSAKRRVNELESSKGLYANELAESRNEIVRLRQQIAKITGEAEKAKRALLEKNTEIEKLSIKLKVSKGEG